MILLIQKILGGYNDEKNICIDDDYSPCLFHIRIAADNTAAPVTDAKTTPIVKPILKLKVDVITVNNAEYIAESNIKNAANVIFTAQLGNAGFSNDVANAKPVVIDFYTGNPLLDVYPNQYLGSAKMNKNGIAQLKVYQKPGEYAGGAIWAKTPWGKIFSNIVMYKVPPIPVKPESSNWRFCKRNFASAE